MIKGPLISSQRYLDLAKVTDKAYRFRVFVVVVFPVVLRGRQYTMIMDGHHNYAAARLAGVEPTYRPIPKKLVKIFSGMTPREIEIFLINNVTDSHIYYVETGEIVEELAMPEYSS